MVVTDDFHCRNMVVRYDFRGSNLVVTYDFGGSTTLEVVTCRNWRLWWSSHATARKYCETQILRKNTGSTQWSQQHGNFTHSPYGAILST